MLSRYSETLVCSFLCSMTGRRWILLCRPEASEHNRVWGAEAGWNRITEIWFCDRARTALSTRGSHGSGEWSNNGRWVWFLHWFWTRRSHVKHDWQTSAYNCMRLVQSRVQPWGCWIWNAIRLCRFYVSNLQVQNLWPTQCTGQWFVHESSPSLSTGHLPVLHLRLPSTGI